MESITRRIIKLDPSLEITEETTDTQYSRFNDAGVEVEVGELLYSFARVLKPNRILETGTHWGIGMAYLALALKDNQKGMLDTIEFLPEIYAEARVRAERLKINDYVRLHLADVTEWEIPKDYSGSNETIGGVQVMYDMILLDTEPNLRFKEFIKFWDSLNYGGYLFIHDLHRHLSQHDNEEHGFGFPFGKVPAFMNTLIESDVVRLFHFPTPRGLTGFYKVHKDDYKHK